MSFKLAAQAIETKGLKPSEKLLLIILADFCNADGVAWPGIKVLAELVGVKDRQVKSLVAALKEKGLLRVQARFREDGSQASNVFWLDFEGSSRPPEDEAERATPSSAAPPPPKQYSASLEPTRVRTKGERDKSLSLAGAPNSASRQEELSPLPDPPKVPPKAEAGEPKPKAPRPRNELFDALAEVQGCDLSAITKSAAGRIAKALKEIKEACPDLTAEEIRARARRYREKNPTWTLTASALAIHWAELGKHAFRSESGEGWPSVFRHLIDLNGLTDEERSLRERLVMEHGEPSLGDMAS